MQLSFKRWTGKLYCVCNAVTKKEDFCAFVIVTYAHCPISVLFREKIPYKNIGDVKSRTVVMSCLLHTVSYSFWTEGSLQVKLLPESDADLNSVLMNYWRLQWGPKLHNSAQDENMRVRLLETPCRVLLTGHKMQIDLRLSRTRQGCFIIVRISERWGRLIHVAHLVKKALINQTLIGDRVGTVTTTASTVTLMCTWTGVAQPFLHGRTRKIILHITNDNRR